MIRRASPVTQPESRITPSLPAPAPQPARCLMYPFAGLLVLDALEVFGHLSLLRNRDHLVGQREKDAVLLLDVLAQSRGVPSGIVDHVGASRAIACRQSISCVGACTR